MAGWQDGKAKDGIAPAPELHRYILYRACEPHTGWEQGKMGDPSSLHSKRALQKSPTILKRD